MSQHYGLINVILIVSQMTVLGSDPWLIHVLPDCLIESACLCQQDSEMLILSICSLKNTRQHI